MYEIILKDKQNEYSIPYSFYFDTFDEAVTFLESAIIHGEDIQATISYEEME